MYKNFGLACLLVLVLGHESFSQKKNWLKDFFRSKEKLYNYDTINVIDESWFVLDDTHIDSLELMETEQWERQQEEHADPPIILSYDHLVEVVDGVSVDSVWLSVQDYYRTWSSWKVNPYDLDGENFQDTVNLPLVFREQSLNWSIPIQGEVTSPFGLRRWRWHYGDDIRLKVGDSVRAAFDGVIRIAKYDRYGYGHYVMIRHYNGLETIYGHLKKRLVKVGEVIRAGEVIGLGGNTGRSTAPHLHFEARYQGNAIDPKTIFNFRHGELIQDSLSITSNTFAYLKEARKIRYHRVRSGDTLSHISYQYGVSVNKICRLNGIRRSSILRIGQRLRIT